MEMRNSRATEEVREIRDRLSLRLLSMSQEERSREFREAVESFGRDSGRPVATVDRSKSAVGAESEAARV
jgi:hypothetical protein